MMVNWEMKKRKIKFPDNWIHKAQTCRKMILDTPMNQHTLPACGDMLNVPSLRRHGWWLCSWSLKCSTTGNFSVLLRVMLYEIPRFNSQRFNVVHRRTEEFPVVEHFNACGHDRRGDRPTTQPRPMSLPQYGESRCRGSGP